MSETPVKLEPTDNEDEEDGIATPEKIPVSDYQATETMVLTKQEGPYEFAIPFDEMQSENQNASGTAIPTEEMRSETLSPGEPVQRSLVEDSVLNSAIKKTHIAVVVKSEDPGLASAGISPIDGQGTAEYITPQQPRIRLVPANRLSVRPELFDAPVSTSKDSTNLPEEYFDDLLAPVKTLSPGEPVQRSLVEDSVLNSAIIKTNIAVVVKSEDPGLASAGTSPIDGQGTADYITPQQPRVRLVPAHRLSVRPELFDAPVSTSKDSTNLPEEYFDDLLAPVKIEPAPVKIEPAPPNFFDELGKQLKEEEEIAEMYNEDVKTQEIEEKYSEKVKILNELRADEKRSKDKKKHKKSKKKSHKRSRPRSRDSRSPMPKRKPKEERCDEALSPPPSTSRRDRSSKALDMNENAFVSHISNPNDFCLENEPPRRLTAAADVEILDATEIVELVQPHLPAIEPDLTTKQKSDRILLRAKLLASYLKELKVGEKKPLTPFMFTSTVRKLPASHSFYTQNIYENRSPLHTINNVSYLFNSNRSQFDFIEWGLATMPPISAKIAKLIGFDAEAVHNKLKVTKIPSRIRNIKSEKQNDEEDEVELQSKSSLHSNATTQTDDIDELFVKKGKRNDIGIQVKPVSHVIACQTLETESPSIKKFDNDDNLPIMAIMRQLNENQLMALHDFAELLQVPPSNAMDMYCLRQKMLEIYKCSQLPSAMDAPVPGIGNSYSTNKSSQQGVKMQQNSAMQIQTLTTSHQRQIHSGNDVRDILPDPRYRQHINNVVITPNSPISQSRVGFGPRNRLYSQMPSDQNDISQRSHGYHTLQQPSHSQIQQPSPPGYSGGTNYYGHGTSKR